tara:strand:+ start:10367 stop:11725 length:1359 start_codon:yes stop_codon:yes gene_type:complete
MASTSRMMFPDSGLVVGPSHSDGGVQASVANGPDVELEGGEFIINKEATEDFLPLIKQINNIGRMEQMNNANNAQNAHSAIDALIASASTQMMPGGGMVEPKTPMYQQGDMIQYQDGGPLHSRRMFNQGTGFDKKKSDLNKDGKISEYEKKRGMAIAKSMKNQMQVGGMVGMQQPMMQMPMNPAMNLSPMQRMGNNMPPMMYEGGGKMPMSYQVGGKMPMSYQDGGQLLPSLNTIRGMRKDAMSVLDNVGIENLRQAAMDTLMKMDMRPQEEKSLFGSGQPVGMRGPRFFGPPAPRKQKEMRQKNSDLDELLKGLVIEVNPFTGDTITEQSIKEELERIKKRVEQSKEPRMQDGGMISGNNLMGAMVNDKRVAPLKPDVYSSMMENGMTGAEAMVVPKLSEAILPVYGIETPLSKKQSSMLKKNAVSPSALNPNLKGLVNRLLVQRLANEPT